MMDELKDLLSEADRAALQVPLRPGGLEELARYRDRRNRNRRVASAVLALTVSAAGIGLAVRAFTGGSESQQPARPVERDVITPEDASRLEVAWTAPLPSSGWKFSDPVAADGAVFVGSADNALYAFPEECEGRTCEPQWMARTEGAVEALAVADGVVYASAGRTVYAFPGACSLPTCEPLWTAETGGEARDPVVEGGVVHVTAATTLYAFPTTCGSEGSVCDPLWTADIGGRTLGPPFAAEGLVLVETDQDEIRVFPAGCGSGGAVCQPLWTATAPRNLSLRAGAVPVIDGGMVYAPARADGISEVRVFAADCATGGAVCEPLRIAPLRELDPHAGGVSADQRYVFGSDLQAFPAGCNPLDASCDPLWAWKSPQGTHTIGAVAADGVVYVTYHEGVSARTWVSALPEDCGSGETACDPLGTWLVESEAGPPAVAGGAVYVLAGSGSFVPVPGRLYALTVAPEGPVRLWSPYLAVWLALVGLGVLVLGRRLIRRRRAGLRPSGA
jgi:outer membrane protein assembly factor BamB